ncbi:hypothetical protein AMJ86_05415 [bacterium SM23_57]|nr:MAG: hypothetical protein AMJ86_05415 [bacterium SM23_57]
MEHKFIQAMWKSKSGLTELVKSYDHEGWSVVALGEVFGGDLLVMTRDDHVYEHEIISVLWKDRKKVEALVAEKAAEGWQVCAIGECFGSSIMVLKRRR